MTTLVQMRPVIDVMRSRNLAVAMSGIDTIDSACQSCVCTENTYFRERIRKMPLVLLIGSVAVGAIAPHINLDVRQPNNASDDASDDMNKVIEEGVANSEAG